MSWAFYNGELTDLSPGTKDVFDGAQRHGDDDRHGRQQLLQAHVSRDLTSVRLAKNTPHTFT